MRKIILISKLLIFLIVLSNCNTPIEKKVSAVWAKRKGFPTGKRSSLKKVVSSFINAFPSLLLVVVIGGIVAGIFTATEASAVAVLYCLILT